MLFLLYVHAHVQHVHSGYNECVGSEVLIEAGRAGPFSTSLHCHLEQSTQALSILLQGNVQVHVTSTMDCITVCTQCVHVCAYPLNSTIQQNLARSTVRIGRNHQP